MAGTPSTFFRFSDSSWGRLGDRCHSVLAGPFPPLAAGGFYDMKVSSCNVQDWDSDLGLSLNPTTNRVNIVFVRSECLKNI